MGKNMMVYFVKNGPIYDRFGLDIREMIVEGVCALIFFIFGYGAILVESNNKILNVLFIFVITMLITISVKNFTRMAHWIWKRKSTKREIAILETLDIKKETLEEIAKIHHLSLLKTAKAIINLQIDGFVKREELNDTIYFVRNS